MRLMVRVLTLGILLASCSTATVTQAPSVEPSSAPSPAPTSTPVLGPPINVVGAAKTGVSHSFKLAAGSYVVDWVFDAPKGGCVLGLFLARKANGPAVRAVSQAYESSGTTDGSGLLLAVPAGTYILQEKRSARTDCKGAWHATLTLQP